MPRIRTIKPEFWTDDKVLEISIPARLFFIGLWSFADDHGVIENKPRSLKARLFPADNIGVEPLIQALAQQKMIILYQVEGQNYLMVTNFLKHQVIDKPRKNSLPTPSQATDIVEVKDFHGNQLKSILKKEGKRKERGKRVRALNRPRRIPNRSPLNRKPWLMLYRLTPVCPPSRLTAAMACVRCDYRLDEFAIFYQKYPSKTTR